MHFEVHYQEACFLNLKLFLIIDKKPMYSMYIPATLFGWFNNYF